MRGGESSRACDVTAISSTSRTRSRTPDTRRRTVRRSVRALHRVHRADDIVGRHVVRGRERVLVQEQPAGHGRRDHRRCRSRRPRSPRWNDPVCRSAAEPVAATTNVAAMPARSSSDAIAPAWSVPSRCGSAQRDAEDVRDVVGAEAGARRADRATSPRRLPSRCRRGRAPVYQAPPIRPRSITARATRPIRGCSPKWRSTILRRASTPPRAVRRRSTRGRICPAIVSDGCRRDAVLRRQRTGPDRRERWRPGRVGASRSCPSSVPAPAVTQSVAGTARRPVERDSAEPTPFQAIITTRRGRQRSDATPSTATPARTCGWGRSKPRIAASVGAIWSSADPIRERRAGVHADAPEDDRDARVDRGGTTARRRERRRHP